MLINFIYVLLTFASFTTCICLCVCIMYIYLSLSLSVLFPALSMDLSTYPSIFLSICRSKIKKKEVFSSRLNLAAQGTS